MKRLLMSRKMMLVTFMVLPFLAARPVLAQDTLKLDLGKALEIALPFSVLIPFRNVRRIVLYTSVMECLQKTLEGRNIFVCSFTSKAMISKLIPSWNTPSLTPRVNKSIHLFPFSLYSSLFFLGFRIFFQVLVKLLVEPFWFSKYIRPLRIDSTGISGHWSIPTDESALFTCIQGLPRLLLT